jgi:DNA topoisomerase-1
LNLARDAPIPKCPLPGHAWGSIVCKHDATWLSSYKTDSISSSSHHKYIFLAANSKFKGMNDMKKYQKARRLKEKIKTIREDYLRKIEDKDMRNRQLGTATYLIDTLALRAGNEKDNEEEADTVGCCSLRVEHVTLLPNNQLKLDFLGKDSMRYENTVVVRPEAWKAI